MNNHAHNATAALPHTFRPHRWVSALRGLYCVETDASQLWCGHKLADQNAVSEKEEVAMLLSRRNGETAEQKFREMDVRIYEQAIAITSQNATIAALLSRVQALENANLLLLARRGTGPSA